MASRVHRSLHGQNSLQALLRVKLLRKLVRSRSRCVVTVYTHIQYMYSGQCVVQGLCPFPKTNFQDSKIPTNHCTPKISMLILLTVCHTFQIFHLSLTNFQHFSGLSRPGKCQSKIPRLSRFSRTDPNPALTKSSGLLYN